MSNMENVIRKRNSKLLNEHQQNYLAGCNCRDIAKCPLDGHCLQESIVYKGNVKSATSNRHYIGITAGEFKERFNNHGLSVRNRKYENSTDLSKYTWSLKDINVDHEITWSVLAHSTPYVCGSRKCDLCLTEKLFIMKSDPKLILNERDELVSKCRHRNKHTLKGFKT